MKSFVFIIAAVCQLAVFAQGFSVRGGKGIIQTGLISAYGFTEGSGQVAYSRTQSTQSPNMVGAPEQFFNDTRFWAKNTGVTITDLYAANPLGYQTASRVVLTNQNISVNQNSIVMAAGSHTFSCWVMSNTGGNQPFRLFSSSVGFHIGPNLTATTSWQRFTWTFTASATSNGAVYISTDSTFAAADILIWGAQCEQASSASAYNVNWQSVLGSRGTSDSADPSWTATPTLNTQGSKYALALSSLPTTFTNVTVYAVGKWSGTPVFSGYTPLVTSGANINDLGLFGTLATASNVVSFQFASTAVSAWTGNVNDGYWHALAGSYDGTTLRVWIDNALLAESVTALSPVTVSSLFWGAFNGAAYWPGEIGAGMVYSTAHSPAQMTATFALLHNWLSMRGLTCGSLRKFVVFEGDSITADGSAKYPSLALKTTTPILSGRDFAVAGDNVTNWIARARTVDMEIDPVRDNVLCALEGNSLVSEGAAACFANYKAYCLARRASGWRIVAMTILPRTTPGFNTQRALINASIVGDSSFYDALANIASNATIGPDAAASDTTYYSDGVHPTAAGHALIYPYVRDAINAL